MTFEEFVEEIKNHIIGYMPDDYQECEVILQKVPKNNQILTGLTVKSPFSNIAPTIYLEAFYEEYKEGATLDFILNKIAVLRVQTERVEDFDISLITDFQKARKRIIPKLIGIAGNEEYLKDKLYRIIEDIAVIYSIVLFEGVSTMETIPVKISIFEYWDVTEPELYEIALNNMKHISLPECVSTKDLLLEMFRMDAEDFTGLEEMPADMYVISNQKKINGANVILDMNFMAAVSEKLGKEFYVLPSSLHELIVIPLDAEDEPEELLEW